MLSRCAKQLKAGTGVNKMACYLSVFCFLKSTGDTWTETLAYVLFWGVASIGTFFIILYNGKDFVDAPRLVQKEKIDWICVCGKRLGLEDSIMQNWSLYWPAFHGSRGLCKSFIQEHSLCLVWGCWLRVDLVLLPWWSLYYWDSYIYNLKLVYN